MAGRIFRSLSTDLLNINGQQIRYGHHIRGKPPTIARSLEQRLALAEKREEYLKNQVNIGLSFTTKSKKTLMKEWNAELKANEKNSELEKSSRKLAINIDLEKAREIWWETNGPEHTYRIAEHYGVYQHLYKDAFFYPVIQLQIDYDLGIEDVLARVYTGNVIKPSEAKNQPTVNYIASSDTLWTLLMTTPDGNFTDPSNEYCHWFIGNIPGNDIAKGEQLVDYLRPIPSRGIGYCRYIFVLYKQDKRIDYTKYKKEQPCLNLLERDWNTLEFYREYQDYLTPAGITFFQSDWDQSLTDFYHYNLQMEEPVFEYDFPKPYLRPQEWFPRRRAFNLYLDRYRDPKEINKEFLLKKLKKVHPFRKPEPPLKYPNAHALDKSMPSWLRVETKKERLGWGRINNINE
ncbi:PREDICTED: 39S ribosomal protein L38, mitochondrial [Polistes canadensis]|uniref:39S ribosomal protein L38, mitochondrial n=1 Tax=Polistes canadensis TaxID=91411 RepID=UPI000718D125|nr:PREDICTED: 39S ribosomal protein L38, mitochondrial [Polistes canadensis]